MAQKRALGSAIKGAANVSEFFTVDLEDFQRYDTAPLLVSHDDGRKVDAETGEVVEPPSPEIKIAEKPAAQPAPQSITPPSQLPASDGEYVSPVAHDPLRILPQSLGELKQIVIVENKWVSGGQKHWDNLIAKLKDEGEITDEMQLNDDFPAMFLAIQRHYKVKEAQQQAAS